MGYPVTSDGKQVISTWPTEGTRKTFITPNWCDPTTWFQQAVRVVDEVAACTNVPTYTLYNVDNAGLIDIYHAKISQEDFFKDTAGNSYRVVVKVNDVVKTEQNPHAGAGGDYTIDYTAGLITFLTALTDTDVVKVTYHHQAGSRYTLKPSVGKILKIKSAEVQFSSDVCITDSIRFQPYGYVQVFAPQYLQANGGPYPPNTLIPLGDAVVYKTIVDYINDANGAYPVIPALGGAGWRNCLYDIITFPWNYIAMTDLNASYGMEIRIYLEHEIPFGGAVATATFYCLSVDEA